MPLASNFPHSYLFIAIMPCRVLQVKSKVLYKNMSVHFRKTWPIALKNGSHVQDKATKLGLRNSQFPPLQQASMA